MSGYYDQPRTTYGFNPANVPEERRHSRGPVPDGNYTAEIVESEVKPTRAGGEGINLQWKITGPTHAGRRFFQWINTKHPTSTIAVEIGEGELYCLCVALGLTHGFQDTREMHGRPVRVRLGTRQQDGYDPQNTILDVLPIEGPTGQGTAAPWGQQQAPPPASTQQGPPAHHQQAPPPQQQHAPQQQYPAAAPPADPGPLGHPPVGPGYGQGSGF